MDNSTTHSVYRIVCFATGKCYVGQTNDPQTRKRNHFSLLKKNKHYNVHLQNAYNKYGKFYFEVLERNISVVDINQREIDWIIHFDSYENGYNLTRGGDAIGEHSSIKCIWNGIEYPSSMHCDRALNLPRGITWSRLYKGYTCDADLSNATGRGSRKVTWNGVEYKSVSECARANGVKENTMVGWTLQGLTCDDDVVAKSNQKRKPSDRQSFRKSCEWNGITYKSVTECAKANGLSLSPMARRIKLGYKSDADVNFKKSQRRLTSQY